MEVLGSRLVERRGGKWPRAGDQLVEHNAERVEIATRIRVVPLALLGREVSWRAKCGRGKQLGQAKISDLQLIAPAVVGPIALALQQQGFGRDRAVDVALR